MLIARFLLAASIALAGCTSPGQSYVAQHPSLPPEHRQILTSGKIPSGTAVAGMTHEQVRLAMGSNPDTYDRIEGEEAWIYSRKKLVATELSEIGGSTVDFNAHKSDTSSASINNTGPQMDVITKTTIFFRDDRATHAQLSEEHP